MRTITMIRAFVLTAVLMTCLLGAVSRLVAAPLSLSGEITAGQTSFAIADLQAFTAITTTANGNSYVGASLWTVLGSGARIDQTIAPGTNANNPIRSRYIMATGADGRMSLLSVGEIHAQFGAPGTPYPYLLAYKENGMDLTTPKLVVLEDPTGTRNMTDVVNLDVRNVARQPQMAAKGTPSSQLKLTGTNASVTYDLAGLKTLPATTLPGVAFGGGTAQDYKGVDLWDLLTSVGVGSEEDFLTSCFLATGSDGFEVVFSLAELNPAFHPAGDTRDLVAYAATNRPASDVLADFGSAGPGFARIVKPGDLKGGRYVSNLTSLEIVDTVPLPATITLLLVGLAGMLPAVCRWRPSTVRPMPEAA